MPFHKVQSEKNCLSRDRRWPISGLFAAPARNFLDTPPAVVYE